MSEPTDAAWTDSDPTARETGHDAREALARVINGASDPNLPPRLFSPMAWDAADAVIAAGWTPPGRDAEVAAAIVVVADHWERRAEEYGAQYEHLTATSPSSGKSRASCLRLKEVSREFVAHLRAALAQPDAEGSGT